ncbi:hypothetical protein BGX23_001693 [Mortierella sp. AD031]|nr:hypothetical protein BGX23_001693 [Mortierella sp. AD031]
MSDPLASTKALAIPEILCLIFDCMDAATLREASVVCKEWDRLASKILSRQLVIPNDWYSHDLTNLWSYLDRRGDLVKALSLELSPSTRLVQEVDMTRMTEQLGNILSRTPNVERLDIQVPREVKSDILATVGQHAKRLQHFETNLLNWEPTDMASLLTACSEIRHVAGHNFTGHVLEAIAQSQPLLSKIDCTHPRFDDEELIAFAKQFPSLLHLSVSLHQFLTAKALIGVADYCFELEYLNFHFCLSLQSTGFQALLSVSPNLRFLDLGLTEVHDADIALVAHQCPKLESLKLPFCGNLTHTSIRSIVQQCARLSHLDVSFCDKIMLSIFDDEAPWVCAGLQYLNISGIHSSYSVEASIASALLPSMYRQLGRLTDLRTLKLSGHGFSLQLLDKGREGLSRLKRLERLDITKLRNPLPWTEIIEIGNLFPKLTELQFRSNDVIPPLSSAEQRAIDEARAGHRIKRGRFVDEQPQPIHQDEGDEEDGCSTSLPAVPTPTPTSISITTTTSSSMATTTSSSSSSSTGSISTSTEPSLQKRKRSRSPTPTDSTLSTTTTAAEGPSVTDIMSATLRSGLKISFWLSGEDEEDGQGGPGDFGGGGGGGWGFPEGMPF